MNQRWKYGNYTFRINPNGHDTKYSVVGDDVRTLSGAVISQPTGVTEGHSVQAVFYQPRTRIINELSLSSASFIAYGNNLHALIAASQSVNVYSEDLSTVISTISLSSIPSTSYVGFDVSSGYLWVAIDAGTTAKQFYKINPSGTVVASFTLSHAAGKSLKDIAVDNGVLYTLWDDYTVQYSTVSSGTNTAITVYRTIYLPNTAGYFGLGVDSGYLIAGSYDYDNNTIFHIDVASGMVVNGITTDGINAIDDVAFDGKTYLVLNRARGTIQYIQGNTTQLDLFKFRVETASGYVRLTDYRGVQVRVAITDLSVTRRIEYEHMYEVSASFMTVDRGVQ